MTYFTQSTSSQTSAWTKNLAPFDSHPSVDPKGPRISRPMNSWMYFRKQKARDLKEANPGLNLTQAAVSKIISEVWRGAPDHVRSHYTRIAEEGRIAHSIKYPNYKLQPRLKKPRARSTTLKQTPYSSSLSTFAATTSYPPPSPSASSSSSSSSPTSAYFPSYLSYDIEVPSSSLAFANQSLNNPTDFFLSASPEPRETDVFCYVSSDIFDSGDDFDGGLANWAREGSFESEWTWTPDDYKW